MDEDWGFHELLLEPFECKLLLFSPLPGLIFLGEIIKGVSKVGEVVNEAPVKTTKTKEGMNIFEFGQSWPILKPF